MCPSFSAGFGHIEWQMKLFSDTPSESSEWQCAPFIRSLGHRRPEISHSIPNSSNHKRSQHTKINRNRNRNGKETETELIDQLKCEMLATLNWFLIKGPTVSLSSGKVLIPEKLKLVGAFLLNTCQQPQQQLISLKCIGGSLFSPS